MIVHYIGLGKTWKLIHQKWTFLVENIFWAKHCDSAVRGDINPVVQNRRHQELGKKYKTLSKKIILLYK